MRIELPMVNETVSGVVSPVLPPQREVPFNYTSAEDRQAVSLLLGKELLETLEELRSRRVTGRSARLLMRFFGEILIHRRNPYLFQELVDSRPRRRRLFGNAVKDLAIIESHAAGEGRVLTVLAACRKLLAEFRAEVEGAPELRRRLKHDLGAIVGPRSVLFDPFALVAHATDATDWRLHLPVAVAMPGTEAQVAPLLAAIARMGLKASPRGAGTGLTGGAVPLRAGCVIVNTEKLNHILGVRQGSFEGENGEALTAAVLNVEAGVITEKAMEYAHQRGLVFATDPTSAWASTIGGNISENAGGKDAVRWGTCIDNLVSWRMAMPGGLTWTVRRTVHHLRKILHQDTVTFEVTDEAGHRVKRIALRGDEIRKKGLWKDITNKTLGGLPGLQKEGTDGVITSAEFILYPVFESSRTVCLEFFGPDFEEASRVILEIARAFPFPDQGAETLLALEHFDDEYVRAIGYKVKAARTDTPKAVLIIDLAGHSAEETARGVARIRTLLESFPNTQVFEARDKAEATLFWADRKKLGAIARRTNAFKLNEDIVIPLETLAEFAGFIDHLNVEEERHAQGRFLDGAERIFQSVQAEAEGAWAPKRLAAGQTCQDARLALAEASPDALRTLTVLESTRHRLAGLAQGYPGVLADLQRLHQELRERRIVLATHMHAGDGNVHVNVPVLSNDRAMFQRADQVIDTVMEKVMALGGVVSGEHGIGITKLKYMDKAVIEELNAYRREVDPGGLMNPGKLQDHGALKLLFTPSFNLLGLEARILQHGQLAELAARIAHCVRCAKCKPDCCVFHPGRGLFYHPRNKNLAIGSLIEALLYDAQRDRSTHFELLQWLEDVADHCTICHKCLKPCPVDIDTGEVSVLEREILASWGFKKTPLATRLTLRYLDSRSVPFNRVFRATVLRGGGWAQRAMHRLAAPLQPREGASALYPLRLLSSPVAPMGPETLRDGLPQCEPDQTLVFEPVGAARSTVFYFPGCGSERLHADISMAAIHLLLEAGTRVVLPPPYLCCGFPAHVNAKTDQHAGMVLRNSINFSQIRGMLAHLDIDACVVTCGTCMEGLEAMDVRKLFGGRIMDVAAYLAERGLRLASAADHLYHTPCHDSLGGRAKTVLTSLGATGKLETVPHCCSEAGTLALSRPDITDAMLHRKREALHEATHGAPATILTNCPSCLQGLGRNRQLGVTAKHIAVLLAESRTGAGWRTRFREQAGQAKAFTF